MSRFLFALLVSPLVATCAVSWTDSGSGRVDATITPDLSGTWESTEWGTVILARSGDAFEGTYTATHSKDIGRVRLWFSRCSGTFEGVWWEGRYRSGPLSVRAPSSKVAEGSYSADQVCEHRPGFPAAQEFRWTRVPR
jgi:hypothetical protein